MKKTRILILTAFVTVGVVLAIVSLVRAGVPTKPEL